METPADIVAQYTPRDMIEALIQNPRPSTFLLDRLIGRTIMHDTDIIEIDIEKGGQTLAAYVSRVGDANVVGKRDFSTVLHWLPYMYEEIPFTSKDVKTRLPGQNVYQGSAGNRMDEKVGNWLATLQDRMIRREEQQLAEGLQTGKVVVSGKDVDYEVDYQMNASHIITNAGGDIWGSTTEDKIQQLEDDAALSRLAGAPTPTEIYMGVNTARLFMKDEEVLKFLDNRRVQMGEIRPRQLSQQKATYLGTFSRIGLDVDIYSYQAQYTPAGGGAPVYYLDPDKYVMTTPQARFDKHYGMIENLKSGDFIGERYPLMTIDGNGKKGQISLESGPLAAVHQPDAVVVRKTQ